MATIPPGNVSINQISKHIGLDNKTIANFIEILSDTCLIRRIPINKSGSALSKTKEKIFLENTNMYHAISSDIGDFEVEKKFFEIGGKSKNNGQVKKEAERSFIVKDDILYGEKGVIPLYLFGFLY